MNDLACLLFKGEKIVLNDEENSGDEEGKEPDFMQALTEEARNFNDAVESAIAHYNREIDQARSYSALLREKKNSMMSPRISVLAQQHADSLTPQIVGLCEDIAKVQEIRDEVLEKIKEVLEQGSEDIVSYRYTGKKTSQDLSPLLSSDTGSPTKTFQPKVCSIRLTDHYHFSSTQNFESPAAAEYSFDKHIIGIGDYGNLQFYFIYSDMTQTEIEKKGSSSKNKEMLIHPPGTQIRKVRIQYFVNYSDYADGTFAGLIFFDAKEEPILQAGFINKPNAAIYAVKDFDIAEGERLLGIKSDLREKGQARHWDL